MHAAVAGTLDLGFSPQLGDDRLYINSLLPRADGSVYVGGRFDYYIEEVNHPDLARLKSDGSYDESFNANLYPVGLNCLALQPDGKLMAGDARLWSDFIYEDITRFLEDGSLDKTFRPEYQRFPNDMVIQSDGKVVIVGSFYINDDNFHPTRWISGVARFLQDGKLDITFNPGLNKGTDDYVETIVQQGDGKFLIGGRFRTYNGVPRRSLARLNTDGTLDLSFSPNLSSPELNWYDDVTSIAIQPDGKILVAGLFETADGVPSSRFARLNPDGTRDASFNAEAGGLYFPKCLAVQADGKILVGGSFSVSYADGWYGRNIVRLDESGQVDEAFKPLEGPNGDVEVITVQPDGEILIGGDFDCVDGVPRPGVARLHAESQPLTATLRTDMNGDHVIDRSSGSPDQTTAAAPFRFWLNDDNDDNAEPESGGMDLLTDTPDNADDHIDCVRDLEDFALLKLQLPAELRQRFRSGGCRVKFTMTGDASIRLMPVARPDYSYLTDYRLGLSMISTPGMPSPAPMSLLSSQSEANVAFELSGDETGDIELGVIFEGVHAGDGVLKATVYDASGLALVETEKFQLQLANIVGFYDHFTVGDSAQQGYPVATDPLTLHRNSAFSGDPGKPYVLYVHGWRMRPAERRAFAETAFKRLYWQGYRGGFGLFSWPTEWVESDKLSQLADVRNYDRSEFQAWKSAQGLRTVIDRLETGSSPRLRLLAHSMGNIVASEALRLGAIRANSRKIACYVASQAASPAGAYDARVPSGWLPEWMPDFYRSWTGAAAGLPRPYFTGISSMSERGIVNFCNPGDYALGGSVWGLNQFSKPDPLYSYRDIPAPHFEKLVNVSWEPFDLNLIRDVYEMFSFAAPADSRALGAEPTAKGEIGATVRLDGAPLFYGTGRWDHSAAFLSSIQRQAPYWQMFLSATGLGNAPEYPVSETARSYQEWSAFWFANESERTGLADDFDGDGLSNLYEYVFVQNPRALSGGVQVSFSTGEDGSDFVWPALDFQCRAGAQDVEFYVEGSEDLEHWNDESLLNWSFGAEEQGFQKVRIELYPEFESAKYYRVRPQFIGSGQ